VAPALLPQLSCHPSTTPCSTSCPRFLPCPLRPSPPVPWFLPLPSLLPFSSPCSFCARTVCRGIPAPKPDAQPCLQEIPCSSPTFQSRTQEGCRVSAVEATASPHASIRVNGDTQSLIALRNAASFHKNSQSTFLMRLFFLAHLHRSNPCTEI